MKKILFIIAMLFGVAYGQTIGYLRYDSVKMAKNGGTTELILENATKAVTGGVLTNTGNGRTAFVLGGGTIVSDSAWMLTGNAGTVAGTNFLGTTDNVDLVFKRNSVESGRFSSSGNLNLGLTGTTLGSLGLSGNTSGLITLKGQAAAGTYNFNFPTTAGNSGELLTSGGGVGSPMTWTSPTGLPYWSLASGGTLTGTNTINANGNDLFFTNVQTLEFQAVGGNITNTLSLNGATSGIQTFNTSTLRESNITIYDDSIHIEPSLGNLYIDTLQNDVGTKALRYNPTTGLVSYADTTTGGAGSSTWNGITNPTGDQALTFDAGESSTWTDANTTEDLFTVNSSTGTNNSMFSLNRTGTALAAGNNILELVSSGANGTNAITATGARISVTNTNGTSGTNVGLAVTATGATTNNYSIQATGAIVSSANNTDDLGSASLMWRTAYLGTSAFVPLVIGGTATTDDLIFKTTTGAGTTGSFMDFTVGNNGAIRAMRINDVGGIGILAPTTIDANHGVTIKSPTNTGSHGLKILALNESQNIQIGWGIIEASSTLRLTAASGGISLNTTTGVYAGGTTAATSYLQSAGSFSTGYRAISALRTLDITDHTIECTANTFTVTLPTAVGITGRLYFITNSGGGTITIATTSSQTFANVTATPTTLTLNTLTGVVVQSNGANWLKVSSF